VRRHPLTDRSSRIREALGIALVLHLSACQAAGPAPSSPAPGGVRIAVGTAPGETLAFDPAEIGIREVVPVTVTFRNHSSVAHNLVFTDGLSAATRTIVEPGTFEDLHLVPPGAGVYPFVCTIHSEMAGRLVVGGSSPQGY
jgi:plastocyanin